MRPGFSSNKQFRFLLRAALLYLACFFVYQFVVRKYSFYDQRFISFIIYNADAALQGLGYTTFKVLQDRDMQVLGIDGGSGVWIGSNCNAITLFFLFAVFVIAYPGRIAPKFWFVPAGILAIHLLNVLRVVGLAIINFKAPEYLDFNHTYTFTFLMYGFIFSLWILWVNYFSGEKTKADS